MQIPAQGVFNACFVLTVTLVTRVNMLSRVQDARIAHTLTTVQIVTVVATARAVSVA